MGDFTKVALHNAFLRPFGASVVAHSALASKPLEVDLLLPLPPRLRVYLYNLVGGVGTKRQSEYKAVLRVPGQKLGHYGSFDHSGDRLAVLAAYRDDLDVFVLWDASLHAKFKWAGNIQVREDTVLTAAATGWGEQRRSLSSTGVVELVIACQSWNLPKALCARLSLVGGVSNPEWATFQS